MKAADNTQIYLIEDRNRFRQKMFGWTVDQREFKKRHGEAWADERKRIIFRKDERRMAPQNNHIFQTASVVLHVVRS